VHKQKLGKIRHQIFVPAEIFTARCNAELGYEIACRPSIGPSVSLSVTIRYRVQMGAGKNGPGKNGPGKKGPVKRVQVKTVLGKNGLGKKGPSDYLDSI